MQVPIGEDCSPFLEEVRVRLGARCRIWRCGSLPSSCCSIRRPAGMLWQVMECYGMLVLLSAGFAGVSKRPAQSIRKAVRNDAGHAAGLKRYQDRPRRLQYAACI